MDANDTPLNRMSLFALKMEGGYALVMAGRMDDGRPFFAAADSDYVIAFRLKASTPSQIMLNVRKVCAQIGAGHVNFDIKMPLNVAASLPVMASFDVLTGCVENVAPHVPEVWEDLRTAAKTVSFLSTPGELRAIRNLAHEVIPGVMQTAAGDLAVHDGDAWEPLDKFNADALAEMLLPKIAARKKEGDWQAIYTELVRIVPAHMAKEAMEMFSGNAFDFVNEESEISAPVGQSPVKEGPVSDFMNARDEFDDTDEDDDPEMGL